MKSWAVDLSRGNFYFYIRNVVFDFWIQVDVLLL